MKITADDWKPIPRFIFHLLYRLYVPWDIGRVQPAVADLHERGELSGRILDVGCGFGETTIYLAQKGYDVRGIDLVPAAINKARSNALEKGLHDLFFVHDALRLDELTDRFDTLIDVGLFHTLSDRDRRRYETSEYSVLKESGRLFMLCFSSLYAGFLGPRRVSESAIYDLFAPSWKIEYIRQTCYLARFPRGGADAWLVCMTRLGKPDAP